VFDAINKMKKKAHPGSAEDFDFFITTGDNIYPRIDKKPMTMEFATMMGLFKRESIKELPIYPVRGSQDCKFKDQEAEIKLSKKYP